MREKGVTLYWLQKLGFNRATDYSVKRGQSVSANTIAHLCGLLHCRVEDVMEYIDDDES
nr:helix-turn-helix transcriptional regulator [uncultured Oscillibacter sp.]